MGDENLIGDAQLTASLGEIKLLERGKSGHSALTLLTTRKKVDTFRRGDTIDTVNANQQLKEERTWLTGRQ